NTHRYSAPLLKTPATSKTARSAAPQAIHLVSACLATRSAQWHEQDWNDLPPHRRTEQLSGSSEGRTEAQQEAKTTIFRHEGEYWQIVYKGDCIRIRSAKGVLYLRHLLQHPGEHIHVCALAALGDNSASVAKATESSADRGIDVAPPEAPLMTNEIGAGIAYGAT